MISDRRRIRSGAPPDRVSLSCNGWRRPVCNELPDLAEIEPAPMGAREEDWLLSMPKQKEGRMLQHLYPVEEDVEPRDEIGGVCRRRTKDRGRPSRSNRARTCCGGTPATCPGQ